ncbi:MAG: transglycosylase domain-containing protein [Candidatus Rokuibacteriota bacterium]
MRTRSILIWSAVGVACAVVLAVGWSWRFYRLPDPASVRSPSIRLTAEGSDLAVVAADGKGSDRIQFWVPLNQMPPALVAAVITAEDRRFKRHVGVDPLAVGRAAVANAREAEVVRGASTITQQLARGLFLSRERTYWRKAREMAIALVLELRYSKRKILEAYLNTVYLGQHRGAAVLGVAAGSHHLFGKDLGALRLDEMALLATAIRAPNRVFTEDLEKIRARRDALLRAMAGQRPLTDRQLEVALAQPVRRPTAAAVRAPWFVDVARGEASRRVTASGDGVAQVATTLDRRLQAAAEAAVRDHLARAERARNLPAGRLQAAVVALEPSSGRIRALVGGRSFRASEFNRAVHAHRQPGSLFKPFVYLAAFESPSGPTPATLVEDQPVVIRAGNREWSPHNMDGRYRGPVTVRQALEASLNVPAAMIAQRVGLREVGRVAHAAGIESPLPANPSLALGTSETTLLEMTTAFATLANGGYRVHPTALDVDQSSAPIAAGPAPVRAVSAQSAFIVTHLLRGVMVRGTGGSSARWGLQDVTAGKTGTTDGLRDAWFIGYTPDLVIGVWVGADDASPIGFTGSEAALPIWATIMQSAVRRSLPSPFRTPAGIVMTAVDQSTGKRACPGEAGIAEAFREGREPPPCESVAAAFETPFRFLGWIKRSLGLASDGR